MHFFFVLLVYEFSFAANVFTVLDFI